MVRIFTAQIVNMQGHVRVINETLKELMGQVHIERTDHGAFERHMEFKSGTTGKIDHDSRQGFVQRHIGMAITAYAFFITYRASKCLT